MATGELLRPMSILFAVLLIAIPPSAAEIRQFSPAARFVEAPHFRNGDWCPRSPYLSPSPACDPVLVRIAMTLDSSYLRGTVAAVYSLLHHASCPDDLFLHFVTAGSGSPDLGALMRSTFPSLRFDVHPFNESLVQGIISPSVREALENPLNYARAYLADLLPACVGRVIYLDSDVVVLDDVAKLWGASLAAPAVVAAPEYCRANFTRYFTDEFWASGLGGEVFAGRRPCYFNTGVMVIDLRRWRRGEHRERIEGWMRLQMERRIYELGSLPPFLLEFAGKVEAVEHRWNQHGLGGDNNGTTTGRCREIHPGPVSLLHWSGREKPWDRIDGNRACPVDVLWARYDLHRPTAAFS